MDIVHWTIIVLSVKDLSVKVRWELNFRVLFQLGTSNGLITVWSPNFGEACIDLRISLDSLTKEELHNYKKARVTIESAPNSIKEHQRTKAKRDLSSELVLIVRLDHIDISPKISSIWPGITRHVRRQCLLRWISFNFICSKCLFKIPAYSLHRDGGSFTRKLFPLQMS